MLPKELRLQPITIREVLKNGIILHQKEIQCFFLRTTEKHSKFALIVPLTKTRCAAKRNRIKRLFRLILTRINTTTPYPINAVFIIKHIENDVSQQQLEMLLLSLFKKIR